MTAQYERTRRALQVSQEHNIEQGRRIEALQDERDALRSLNDDMAAAILAWDDCPCGETNDCACYTNLQDLAEKLRMIGDKR